MEIAPVLTLDVVEHSTLLINEQSRLMGELTRVVKGRRDFLLATIQKGVGPQGDIHARIAHKHGGVGDKPNALREANSAIELEGDNTYLGPSAEEVLAIAEDQTGKQLAH